MDTEPKIEWLKTQKLAKLNTPIVVGTTLFIGGYDAYSKYQLAYELGKDVGATEGELLTVTTGVVAWELIDEPTILEYFKKVKVALYTIEKQYSYLLYQIHTASSNEELALINWG